MPGREREREKESQREREREREKGRKINKHKKKVRARYDCSIGGGTISDLLEAAKEQKETKKNLPWLSNN